MAADPGAGSNGARPAWRQCHGGGVHVRVILLDHAAFGAKDVIILG